MPVLSNQPTEGVAMMEYKLIIDQKNAITFDPNRVLFSDAEIKDDVYGNGVGMHTFTSIEPSMLDTVKQAMSTADPIMEFRLGFGLPQNTYWLPWQQHSIVKYNAKFQGISNNSGHLLVFATSNNFVRLEKTNKTLARKGSIAEIVRFIADENKMESVIEPTDGKFLIYQTFQDDANFIRERLISRAITPKGKSGFYLYIRDNVLHFHTPDYQANALSLDYYRSFGTDLSVIDASQDAGMWDAGLAGVQVIGYDPQTGKNKEVKSQPGSALRLADSIYQYGKIKNGEANVPYHLSYNPPVEVNAIAQSRYQLTRQGTFKCSVNLEKTISIRHGDLLNIGITQQPSKSSSFSGLYYVTSAAHIVKSSSVSSVYGLERGEIQGQDQSLSAMNAQDQLVPDSKAPGVDPNILEIQSSELTKGAGKQNSNQTYTEVWDPNLA